jgi:hypothetical protein
MAIPTNGTTDSTIMPAVGMGFLAFAEFAAGDWPFKGRKTPKNPYQKDCADHALWQRGYDDALNEWFASRAGHDTQASLPQRTTNLSLILRGLPPLEARSDSPHSRRRVDRR